MGRFRTQCNRRAFPCEGRPQVPPCVVEFTDDPISPRNRTARVALHDLREGGPTDGATACFDISGQNHHGVYIPPGVAHGFSAVTDVVMTYLVDGYYNPADELGVAWDDPAIGADWVVTDPIVSQRDQTNPTRADIPAGRRPYWPMRT